MTLTMKPLTAKHIFPLLSMIGKLDIKDEFVSFFGDNSTLPKDHKKKAKLTEADIEARGVVIVANLIEKALISLPKIEGDINALLADLTGKTVTQIQNLDIEEYGGLIVGFFKKPELQKLFKQLASFSK